MSQSTSTIPEASRSRKTRSQLSRQFLPLLAAAVGLCFVVVWHRDATHMEKACERMQPLATTLKQYFSDHGSLPESVAGLGKSSVMTPGDDFHYASAEVLGWAPHAGEPVVIGFGQRTGLILKPNGYAAIILDEGEIRVEWIPNSDVGARMERQQQKAQSATNV